MRNLVALVLGGGAGTRLRPLTTYRSKPAVPLAGKYRLIDIPISNCINSDVRKVYVLTQFNSVSLHRHIRQTYRFDRFSGGFVEILAAQQTVEGEQWYEGTADAVRKNLRYIEQYGLDYVLILSGDQLYRMDYAEMLRTHVESGADVTIAGLPVDDEKAAGFGIMRLDDAGRVEGFVEKPKTAEQLDPVRMTPEQFEKLGIEANGRTCLASMGIYLFNRDLLVDLLKGGTETDFGNEVFPKVIGDKHVQTHAFDGYWEDIGTIRSFYEANLQMAGEHPPLFFEEVDKPIYTRARHLPCTRINDAHTRHSFMADGCNIGRGTVIENSVVGLRSQIGEDVTVRDSVLMGQDFYEHPEEVRADNAAGRPKIGIGSGTIIEKAIVDKNCHIGRNVRLKIEPGTTPTERDGVWISDGIIVVEKNAVLPDGWVL